MNEILFELAASQMPPTAVAGGEILLQLPGTRPEAKEQEQEEQRRIRETVVRAAGSALRRVPVRCEICQVEAW